MIKEIILMLGNVKSAKVKIKEGRGQKRGVDYIPWLEVREVPSKGRVCYQY